MFQKEVFLATEGNAYYTRNMQSYATRDLSEEDRVLNCIRSLPLTNDAGDKVTALEIGCGQGHRLAWMQQYLGLACSGIDPSGAAIEVAKSNGVDARQGTAESLPFGDSSFDLVIFGFCLYVCDRTDLFQIAAEANRVLKDPGWLIINDFYAPTPIKRPYHHHPDLSTFKMDYSNLFTCHPGYSCYFHEIRHHSTRDWTDDAQEWMAVTLLRKNMASSFG